MMEKIYDILKNDERNVLSTSQGKQKISLRFDRQAIADLSAELRTRLGKLQFILIEVWKILIQFSYRYDWTVTNVMLCEHKIVIIPNLGGRFLIKGKNKANVKSATNSAELIVGNQIGRGLIFF